MGIPVGPGTLYILVFADDQVLVASDEDSSYMFGKLQEVHNKSRLTINAKKPQYMLVGERNGHV